MAAGTPPATSAAGPERRGGERCILCGDSKTSPVGLLFGRVLPTGGPAGSGINPTTSSQPPRWTWWRWRGCCRRCGDDADVRGADGDGGDGAYVVCDSHRPLSPRPRGRASVARGGRLGVKALTSRAMGRTCVRKEGETPAQSGVAAGMSSGRLTSQLNDGGVHAPIDTRFSSTMFCPARGEHLVEKAEQHSVGSK